MCASAGADSTIKVWNVYSQKLVQRMETGKIPAFIMAGTPASLDTQLAIAPDMSVVPLPASDNTDSLAFAMATTPHSPRNSVQPGVSRPKEHIDYFEDGHVDQVCALSSAHQQNTSSHVDS